MQNAEPVRRARRSTPKGEQSYYELEVIPGLAALAQAELNEQVGRRARVMPSAREDRVRFSYTGEPSQLLRLRRAVAVYRIRRFEIPRPKALLGHQNLGRLTGLIEEALGLHGPGSFETFYVSAAGSDSSIFARIKEAIESRTGLSCVEEVGDLLVAVRRPQALSQRGRSVAAGWEVAVRLSPRPLAVRDWRVCDMPGALNGTVASGMMSLPEFSTSDRVVNLACGSGTLLIERLALGPVQGAVGCDIDRGALDFARQNVAASGARGLVRLVQSDAGRVPLPKAWATVVCADLPFGMLVGSHQTNEVLYPRLLDEAGRLTQQEGSLVVITQEVRLFERVVSTQADQWEMTRVIPIKLPANTRDGYIQPRIYLMRRR
jgi:tRNA (guanine6-N2)-methyltransferase